MTSPAYSRDEAIAAITNFYQFFVKLPYVDPSALRLAPNDGWPGMNVDDLRSRGRNDETIELLRRLPYLEHHETRKGLTINDGCVCIQYHKGVCYTVTTDDIRGLPEHVIPIANMADRNGRYLLVETQTGCITEYNIMANNIQGNWEEYNKLPELDKWKAFPTSPAREFFGRWIRLYEQLIWMVAPTIDASHGDRGEYFSRAGNAVEEDETLELNDDGEGPGNDDDEEALAEVYAIYKRHKWPAQFDRDACKSELTAYLEDKDI